MGPEANQAFSRVVSKFHFTLKIPIATYVHAEGPATASLPYHSPTQLLSVLLEKYPRLLMGGCDQEECCRQLLLAFWDCYEQEHPEHEIFKQKNRDRLGKTIPLTMHGDGGRTQKKQPLEICSLQPVLGLNSASCASVSCHCPTSVKHGSGQFGDPLRQCLNSKHNTYMTHFCCLHIHQRATRILQIYFMGCFSVFVMTSLKFANPVSKQLVVATTTLPV